MDANAIFRANLKQERQRRGWSHRQLAERAGTTHPHTYLIESGRQGVTLATLGAIAEALETTPAALLRVAGEATEVP